MNRKTYLIIIISASIITHFLFFGQPRETVFDEVHFGKFISGYFTHEYFFDIHPPLGKLMISGMGYMTGFEPGFSFAQIGQQFPDRNYLWLRLLPTIAGVLLPVVIYFLILQLGPVRSSPPIGPSGAQSAGATSNGMGMSRLMAFAGGMLVILENALLVQSRFILLDSFLLLFGFSALLFYFKYTNYHSVTNYKLQTTNLFFAGIFGALAVSVKWTGATFIALILAIEFVQIIKQISKNRNQPTSQVGVGLAMFKDLAFTVLALIIVPFVIYFSIFALHFALLNKSGPGDAFMTPKFRKTLVGSDDSKNPDIKPLNIFQKFNELNLQMYKSNATLTASHPYSSKWYTWPFMIRPIYYWNDSVGDQQSRIYFLGNPVIWWASTAAMMYLLINLLVHICRLAMSKILKKTYDIASREIGWISWFLGGAFILNLLPFVGIKRAMFLYHYLIGLIFAILALVYLIDQVNESKNPALEKDGGFAQKIICPFQGRGKRIFIILLATSFATFVFFAPLTYGLPLMEKAYNLRVWLKSWL